MQREATERERAEHGWCNQLRNAQSFRFYIDEMQRRHGVAHRNVCAATAPSREYEAGRLSAFAEAMAFVDNKYDSLRTIVEVV